MAFIDRIKYDGPPTSMDGSQVPWLVYKFPSESIVIGSQLIVNKSQEAIFFKGGNALDVFGPGTHTLSTANLPLLQKLINLPFGGKTPFTAEIYFINKVAKLDMKWGTTDPFQILEPRFNLIVKVRAFGQFGMKISDTRNFVTQIVGALHADQVSDYQNVSKYFKGLILTKVKDTIADIIVNKKMSVLDITASLDSISTTCRERITSEFDRFGIEVLNFYIESINVPDEDLRRIKKILEDKAEFEILGDDRYTKKRSFDVLETAASNEGAGGAALGAGMGLGIGLGAGTGMGTAMTDIAKQVKVSQPEKITELIKCPKCGTDNLVGMKFCGKCGEKIFTEKMVCPKCKTENLPGLKFCGNCGFSLQSIKCTKCSFENMAGTKFCGNCGLELRV